MRFLACVIGLMLLVSPLQALAGPPVSTTAKPAVLKKSGFFGPADGHLSLEDIVRKERRYDGKYTWDDYKLLLAELSKPRYRVLPVNRFAADKTTDKVVIGMRHDIDSHPEKAITMSQLEKKAGIRSTYFFLHSAKYYGTVKNGVMRRNAAIDALAQKLNQQGFEIGIHTDLFAMMWDYQFDPVNFIKEEIRYYHDLGIPVTGAAAHGSRKVIDQKMNNMWLFSEFKKSGVVEYHGKTYSYGHHKVQDYGLTYEAYVLAFQNRNVSLTGDIDRRFRDSANPVGDLIAYLASVTPGQKIIILTHPEHWGKPKKK